MVLVTGGYWYERNLVAIGNPLGSALHLGPIQILGPLQPASTTVGTFLFNRHDLAKWYLPGLRLSLGPAWWAIVALAAAGLVAGSVFSSGPVRRMLALVGVISAGAFVFTPQLLTLPPFYAHVPYNFVFNLRYSFCAMLFGLLLLPIIPLPRLGIEATRRSRAVIVGAYGLIVVATQTDAAIWPLSVFSTRFAAPAQGVDSLIGLALGLVVLAIGLFILFGRADQLLRRLSRGLLTTSIVFVLVAGGFGLQELYLHDWYQSSLSPLSTWTRHIQDSRIAITGSAKNIMYPLAGENDSNYVQVIGKQEANGSFVNVTSCAEFDRLISTGHYRYVVATTTGDPLDPTAAGSLQVEWLSRDPAASPVFRAVVAGLYVASVYRIEGTPDARMCDDSAL
jgi:hypothetical protein